MNKLLLTACVAALACGTANANTVFDSQALTAADGGDFITTPETRDSGFNYAAVLQFSQNVTVNQIGLFSSVNNDQNIKFLIFDSEYNGGTGNLLFSQTKFFATNTTAQFIYTDAMSFTFQAGHTYDVGILGSGGSLTGYWSAPDNLTQNGITEISSNANFTDFNSPSTGEYSGVTPFIQLNTGGAVPEPASWALMLGGFGLVGGALRSRRKAAVTFA